jgi:hypothetical protein
MMKKLFSLLLVIALVQTASAAPAGGRRQDDKEVKFTEKVRARILKLGTGPKARVRLKLRDKTKLKGYVSEAGADSFRVTDAKTGTTTSVEYRQVAEVGGRGMSKGKKIAIGLGVTAAGALLVLGVVIARSLPGHIPGGF